MDTSKECLKNGGPKGCWTGCQTREGKGEDPEEHGERAFIQKWNGDTYGTETGKIGKHGRQDAENGDNCKQAAYIYIYIYIYIMLTNDVRFTCEIKYGIFMTNAAFNKKRALYAAKWAWN